MGPFGQNPKPIHCLENVTPVDLNLMFNGYNYTGWRHNVPRPERENRVENNNREEQERKRER